VDQGLKMSIHGVIMEGLNVKNDHINADSWWICGHGEKKKVVMEEKMAGDGSLDYLRRCSFV